MRKYFVLIFILSMFTSCAENYNAKVNNTENEQNESFETFNKRFHSDSLFQLSRIMFPLEGYQRDGWEERKWNRDKWMMHRNAITPDFDSTEFKQELIFTDSMVQQRVWIPNSGFDNMRKFKRMDKKWYLVFYQELNF